MKIRSGFVSNSSSEAFICGYGYTGKDYKRYTPKQAKEILKKILSSFEEILRMYNPDIHTDETYFSYKFEKAFKSPHYITQKDIEEMENWDEKINPDSIGKDLIIYSRDDNTIPWGIFEIIENKFNARRVHLG